MTARILLVDDDPITREGLSELLEMEGFQVTLAGDGFDALDTLNKVVPDIILSDINMPGMDGLTFFRRVRENTAWFEIPFIFLTTRSTREDTRQAIGLGADDYFVKPFDPDDLLICVHSKLKRMNEIRTHFQPTQESLQQNILTMIANTLKTPTAGIVLSTELLALDTTNPDMTEVMNTLQNGTTSLSRVVEQTPWTLKINVDKLHSEIQDSLRIGDTWHAITVAVSTARKWADRDNNITVEYGIHAPGIVRANWQMLSAALAELIANAMIASRHERTIAIEQFIDNNHVCIVISDERKNFPEQIIEELFQTSYSYNNDERTAQGLGLFIARGIIEGHQGMLVVTTHQQGTQTRIKIPCARQKLVEGSTTIATHPYCR